METALLLFLVLPPPAAGARVLTGLHRAGARRAADRHETPRMQRINWNVVIGDVGGEVLRGPIRDGIDLEQRACFVPSRERHPCPLLRMLATDAGDPAGRAPKLAVQRTHFPHFAAGFAVLDRMAEAEHAITANELLDLRGLWRHEPDAQPVAKLR